jgi:BON domain-containing protein
MMRGRVLLLITLVAAVGGCATMDAQQDVRIESEVKARLVAEKRYNLTRLGVLSASGVVYLSGAVESAEARARAVTLAEGVQGVTRVVNRLDVRPAISGRGPVDPGPAAARDSSRESVPSPRR